MASDPELQQVIMSFQDLSVDQLNDSLDQVDGLVAHSTTHNPDLQHLFLNGCYYTWSYKLVRDNIDKKVYSPLTELQ